MLIIFEFVLNAILNFHLDFIFFLIEIIFSLLIIIIFPIIYKMTTIILDKYLFKRIQNINSEIDKLLQSINYNIDANKFFDLLSSSMQDIFGISSLAFVLISDDRIMKIFSEKIDGELVNDIFEMFKNTQEITIISELPDIEKYSKLINKGIEVVVPIKSSELKLLALMILGQKSSKDSYYTNDIDILEKIVIQIGIFVSNMNLYYQILNFNTELQSKVRDATNKLSDQNKKLEKANEDLKGLDQLKDDLISISSHELRTPASIVKGNVYMAQSTIKEYINTLPKNKKNNEYIEKLNRYIERSIESIESEIRIINTLLEASRMGKSDVPIVSENVNLINMIESQVDGFKKDAENKGLKIIYNKTDLPMAYGDRTKIEEVLGNLISNAIKYSERGSIEISTEKDEEFITVHIKDHGVGIPQKDIPELFQKFHRLNNYIGNPNDPKDTKHLLVRPGGTGLGLYVVKGLVERMGGKIWIDSTEGKGSTFSFTIPIAKDINDHDNEFHSQDLLHR